MMSIIFIISRMIQSNMNVCLIMKTHMGFLLFLTFYIVFASDDIDKIHLVFFNGTSIKEHIAYPLRNITLLINNKKFQSRLKTTFYIHGYEQSLLSSSVKIVVHNYLKYESNINIVLLDWSKLAQKTYFNSAARNTERVGRVTGFYVLSGLANGLDRRYFHIIGHSLGCHVAAAIGRMTKIYGVTLSRITGLDCAFPGYFPAFIGMSLSTESADFVDVIHTDSGIYGQPMSFGHVDFWPNGGARQQPGCPNNNVFRTIGASTLRNEFCSHQRSCDFYAESLRYPKNFLAVKCSSYEMFQKNRCSEKIGYMGFTADEGLRGNYFLTTNNKSLFGKGKFGINGTDKVIIK